MKKNIIILLLLSFVIIIAQGQQSQTSTSANVNTRVNIAQTGDNFNVKSWQYNQVYNDLKYLFKRNDSLFYFIKLKNITGTTNDSIIIFNSLVVKSKKISIIDTCVFGEKVWERRSKKVDSVSVSSGTINSRYYVQFTTNPGDSLPSIKFVEPKNGYFIVHATDSVITPTAKYIWLKLK